jgi:hypothetical protein
MGYFFVDKIEFDPYTEGKTRREITLYHPSSPIRRFRTPLGDPFGVFFLPEPQTNSPLHVGFIPVSITLKDKIAVDIA